MRTSSFTIFLAIIILLSAIVGLFTYFYWRPQSALVPESTRESSESPALPSKPSLRATDPILGNASAPLTIVEFGDFFCEACAQVEAALNSVLKQYQGQVKLVWKDLPNTQRHPLARRAAQAARCAQEQDKFWPYHDLLLERTQGEQASFSRFVQEVGANIGIFSQCMSQERTVRLVEQSFNEGILLRVDATPYFFIGEKRFSGAIDEATLRSALNL